MLDTVRKYFSMNNFSKVARYMQLQKHAWECGRARTGEFFHVILCSSKLPQMFL